jgi:hypothetical protein
MLTVNTMAIQIAPMLAVNDGTLRSIQGGRVP